VLTGISRLRNNKALGSSWLSADLLKQVATQIAPALVTIFNQVRHSGTPPDWNHVQLRSLLKKGDPMEPSNYRGLAIMAVLPKLYATILAARLDQELDERGSRAPT
jgi:hypothetical protein